MFNSFIKKPASLNCCNETPLSINSLIGNPALLNLVKPASFNSFIENPASINADGLILRWINSLIEKPKAFNSCNVKFLLKERNSLAENPAFFNSLNEKPTSFNCCNEKPQSINSFTENPLPNDLVKPSYINFFIEYQLSINSFIEKPIKNNSSNSYLYGNSINLFIPRVFFSRWLSANIFSKRLPGTAAI